MKTQFPIVQVTQELQNELTAALTRLEATLPKEAHYNLTYEAGVKRFADGTEHIGQRWQCTVMDGRDPDGVHWDFCECRGAPTPLEAAQKVLDRWRRWKVGHQAAELARLNEVRQALFDQQNQQDPFDGGRLS